MTKLTTKRHYKAVAGAVFAFLVCAGSFTPTPVHADFGDFAGSVDYIAGLSDEDVVAVSSSPGALYVAGAILGIYLCTRNPLQAGETYSADSLTVVSGDYYSYRDGVSTLKLGAALVRSGSNIPSDGGFTFAFSDDYEIRTTTAGSILMSYEASTSSNGRLNIRSLDNNQNYVGQIWSDVKGYFTNVNIATSSLGGNVALLPSSIPILTYGSAIPCNTSNWNTRPALLKGSPITLPSGDIDPVVPMLYIDNVLRPYVEINYPDYIYLLPEEEEETGAFDPLEFPPYIPDVDFHDVEVPSETFPTGLTDGAGFWFSAFSTMVDAFNLKSFVILFLCIMLVMVILKI